MHLMTSEPAMCSRPRKARCRCIGLRLTPNIAYGQFLLILAAFWTNHADAWEAVQIGDMPRIYTKAEIAPTTISPFGVAGTVGEPQERTCSGKWLAGWLHSLRVTIPNLSIKNAKGFKAHISHVNCSHFRIGGIRSNQVSQRVTLTAHGLAASCSLHVNATDIALPAITVSERVLATVNNSLFGGYVSLDADAGNPPLPSAIKLSLCTAEIQVTQLDFSGAAAGILDALAPLIKLVLSEGLGDVLCKELETVTKGPGSVAIRNASAKIRDYFVSKPRSLSSPPPLPHPATDFADVGHNPAVLAMQQLLRKVLVNPRSPHNLNKMTKQFLGPNGTLHLTSGTTMLPFQKSITIPEFAMVNVTIETLTLRGLDTLAGLRLKTLGAQEVAVGVAMGFLGVGGNIKVDVAPHGKSPLRGGTLTEHFDLSTSFRNLSTGASMFTAINQTHLGTLAANQLFSWGCVAPAIHTAMELQASLGMPSAQVALTPLGGETLDRAVHSALNSAAALVLGQFASALDAVGNHAMAVNVRDQVNHGIRQALSAPLSCVDPKPTYTNKHLSTILGTASMSCCMVATCLLIASLFSVRSKPKGRTASDAPPFIGSSSDSDMPREMTHEVSIRSEASERRRTDCLCLACHPRLPCGLRWGLPILDLAVICLFIAGHLRIGTSVKVEIIADTQPVVHLPSVFDFSLVSSIKDMWDSGSFLLASMIIIFSGVWPYVKLLTMLICWFAPTGILSADTRLSALEFLDNWGKWSLVDVFVMVLFMVAFHFELSSEDDELPIVKHIFSEADVTGKFIVHVDANVSFHMFVIATLGSLMIGTFMTASHRYALRLAEYSVAAVEGSRQRLCNVMRPPGASGVIFVLGPIAAIFFSLVLVVAGIWIDAFSFTFEGFSGYILGSEQTRTFSAVTLSTAIPGAALDPTSPDILWLMAVFLLFGVLSVLAYHSILIVLWCAPLSPRLQRHFFVAAQVLSGWSALDVLVLSVAVAVMEIERFALFVVGDKCDSVNKLIKYSPIADDLSGQKTCFGLDTDFKTGYWVLLAAAGISSVMGRVMIARCKEALCSIDRELAPGDDSDDDSSSSSSPRGE